MNAYLYHCDRYTSNTSSATWTLRQRGIKSHLLTVTDWQAELLVLPGCSKQSLRSWHQARPTFLVMGLVCVISSWKDNLSHSSQLLSECQRLTDATTLSAAKISIFIISNVKSGSFVPACAIRELCVMSYVTSSGSTQPTALEHRSAVRPWPRGTLTMRKDLTQR